MRIVIKEAVDLIKQFEGLVLHAYKDSTGLPTIGYGTIVYPPTFMDGRDVQIGDLITQDQAIECLTYEVNLKAKAVDRLVKADINDYQFGALVSFTYNLGEAALKVSTLLRKVNINPNDESIATEFLKWNKAKNIKTRILEVQDGLTKRRKKESEFYFKK